MRRPLNGPVRVTSDTAEHAKRGVGPATDYARPLEALPIGTSVVAPFPIAHSRHEGTANDPQRWPGGLSVIATGVDPAFVFVAQHLSRQGATGRVPQGGELGLSGNSGASTGPHLHCYVIAYDVRMSMEEALAKFGDETPMTEKEMDALATKVAAKLLASRAGNPKAEHQDSGTVSDLLGVTAKRAGKAAERSGGILAILQGSSSSVDVDTATILAAIRDLPANVIAELKEAL